MQIFHRSTNVISKATIFGGVLVLTALAFAWDGLNRSSYMTDADVVRDQPVPFSHEHHVGGLGIDCRYCHTSVENSSFAGIPATEVCMSCHSQIWSNSEMLAPVRESYRSGKPLEWTRVHDLPDFVFFNHSIHIKKGVGCESCHGRVDEMPLMRRSASLQMSWCLDCHRHHETVQRDPDLIYAFGVPRRVQPKAGSAEEMQKALMETKQLLDCGTCHR